MATLREIAQLGAPILREFAAAVTAFEQVSLHNLVDDMDLTLGASSGVGIAAPQIFESLRVMIVASRPTPRYPKAPEMAATVMINPAFEALTVEVEKDWEGCLSVPGIRALVPRYQKIGITYADLQGKIQQRELSDFVARVFQHEYDHLNGLVYLDRIESTRDIISEHEFFKLLAA